MILVAVALAAPPERPAPAPPTPGECARSYPLVVGAVPVGVLDPKGVAICGAVIVPSSQLADLLATEVWSEELDARYRIDTAAAASTLAAEQERSLWWKGIAEKKRVDPAVWIGTGIVAGIGVTVAGAWAVSLVAADAAPAQ